MNDPLIPGARYRLVVEGVAATTGRVTYLRIDGGGTVSPAGTKSATTVERLPNPAPAWRPGDVVVVRYSDFGTPFTYVRGSRNWPGERYPKTDAQMNDLFAEGKAEPVLQAGGVPFDKSRLPGVAPSAPRPRTAPIRPMRPGPVRPFDRRFM